MPARARSPAPGTTAATPAAAQPAAPKPMAARLPAAEESRRDRPGIISRSLAAIFGGYILANLFVLAFRHVVPMDPRDASQLALMLSFIVFALVSVWVFATRDALRAWLGVLVPGAICALILWLLPEVRA